MNIARDVLDKTSGQFIHKYVQPSNTTKLSIFKVRLDPAKQYMFRTAQLAPNGSLTEVQQNRMKASFSLSTYIRRRFFLFFLSRYERMFDKYNNIHDYSSRSNGLETNSKRYATPILSPHVLP